jgi:hypothetical protein
MSDNQRCLRCKLSPTPEVSVEALEELGRVLTELPQLVAPTTIRTRRTSVHREVRKDGEEKAGTATRTESDTTGVLARASEASQTQAIELLMQLLMVAQARPSDREVGDER